MVHAHDKKSTNEDARRITSRVLVVFSLSVVSVLIWAIAPRSVVAKAKLSRPVLAGRSERSNVRIRWRSEIAPVTTLAPLLFVAITVDRSDDLAGASACTAAPNDCSLRGAVAFANLNPGTTINVPAGTYQLTIAGAFEGFSGNNSIGDLDVTANNITIVGAGAAATTIQQTQLNDRVLEINPFLTASFNFAISGVTISGGRETTAVGGGGIIAGAIDNTMSVTNCVISGNSASGAGTFGGGGILYTGGSLTITGTTFSSNSSSTSGGGLGYTAGDPLNRRPSNGTVVLSGSSFSGNSANSPAAGGGAADLFDFNGSIGSYNVNQSTFSSNTATSGNGGAIIVESGPLTLTNSSLTGNSAAISGGAIYSSGSANVAYSRLVGNTVPTPANGLTLFNTSGLFAADNNWWGTNSGPSANDFVGGAPPVFLQLRISAFASSLPPGAAATLTADIKQRSIGSPLTTELNGLPAFPVPATIIFNNAVLGTISGASTQFVNGSATATYTAGTTLGTGSVDATADNQTVTANISIQSPSQSIQGLISQVQALQPPLNGQQGQGLISKLNAALTAIQNGNTNVACNKLNDFISQVNAYINNGTLTQAQGQPLIVAANNIRTSLGCH
jgi:hypothetical protein